MSKKNHAPAPVPPGNRSHSGPAYNPTDDAEQAPADTGAEFNDQDAKRRLGGYQTAGEHARVQPGALNDGDTHSK